MLAMAEPMARLRLDCNRLAVAARMAAPNSGNSTMAAMMMPRVAAGALQRPSRPSRVGEIDLAHSTTATSEASSRPTLDRVSLRVGTRTSPVAGFSSSIMIGMKYWRWPTVWNRVKAMNITRVITATNTSWPGV